MYIENCHATDISAGLVPRNKMWCNFGETQINTSLTTPVKFTLKSTTDINQSIAIQGLDKDFKIQTEILNMIQQQLKEELVIIP